MQQVTPRVVGRVHDSTGAPSSALQLALTSHDKDSTCSRLSVRTVTDTNGAFRVPFIEERKSIFWITLAENPGGRTAYWLCAGTVDGSGGAGYQARTHIAGHLGGDTLDCLDWSRKQERRIVCNTADDARFLVGGTWTEGADTGAYRLILADQDSYGAVLRGYVQWVSGLGSAEPGRVHATVELPGGPELAPEEAGPTLAPENGKWYLTLLSRKPTKWGKERWLRFELGPPGHVREVPVSGT